jgi:hypothetical protein
MIDFFSNEDLKSLLEMIRSDIVRDPNESLIKHEATLGNDLSAVPEVKSEDSQPVDDRSPIEQKQEEDEEIYSIKNFSI